MMAQFSFLVIYPVSYKSFPTNVPMSGPQKKRQRYSMQMDSNGFCSEFHFYGNKRRIVTSNELCLKLLSRNELLSVLNFLSILS